MKTSDFHTLYSNGYVIVRDGAYPSDEFEVVGGVGLKLLDKWTVFISGQLNRIQN